MGEGRGERRGEGGEGGGGGEGGRKHLECASHCRPFRVYMHLFDNFSIANVYQKVVTHFMYSFCTHLYPLPLSIYSLPSINNFKNRPGVFLQPSGEFAVALQAVSEPFAALLFVVLPTNISRITVFRIVKTIYQRT